DIATLAVDEHEHLLLGGQGRQLLERVKALAAETLEKRRLRLDDRNSVLHRIQETSAEFERALRVVGKAARFQQSGRRIDSHAPGAVFVDLLLQAFGKAGHWRTTSKGAGIVPVDWRVG